MLVALTVAGSDSVGGAGIEADIKAMASQGVHAAVALTAVTAQNTRRVAGIFPLQPEEVAAQIDAVLEDVHISAVKTGMLYSAAIADAVADRLSSRDFPIVVDPVLVAGVGDPLNREDLVDALRSKIIPIATILTPNIPETEALVGYKVNDDASMRKACRELADLGAEAVLLKGGHLEGATVVDTFYHNGKFLYLEAPRIDVRGHGGGCALAAYLAADLAKGMGLWEATLAAKASVDEAVRSNYPIGHGVPVVDPLGAQFRDAQRYRVSVQLRKVAREMAVTLPKEWVPEAGSNMVFALPGARNNGEVCALESPMMGEDVSFTGGVEFSASRNVAGMVLAAMDMDGGVRSAVYLRFDETHFRMLQKAGLSVGTIDHMGQPVERGTKERTEEAIRALGFVPDAVIDRGAPGIEPTICLFGRSPEELLNKFKRILE